MGLFSSPVAEINVNFYGQKRRNKAISNVQMYYDVTIKPYNLDPVFLGDLYSKAFVLYASIHNMPVERNLFWTYVNESYKNIVNNPSSLFYIWPDFLDFAPIMSQPSGKPCCFVKASLMDNGKMKYKYTENAVVIYYNTLTPIAIMQYIINVLPSDKFQIFFEVFRQRMDEEVRTSKRPDMLAFKLDPLPITIGSKVSEREDFEVLTQKNKFCSSCGHKIVISGDTLPKFCGGCGAAIV